TRGEMTLDGVRLDLKKISMPIYNLATREEHVEPARSDFYGSQFFGGPVGFVLAGSGHIAGVVNPPSRNQYQYWTGGPPRVELENWIANAQVHPGSWWPHWFSWLKKQAPALVRARKVGGGGLKPLADAPGDYVRMKA